MQQTSMKGMLKTTLSVDSIKIKDGTNCLPGTLRSFLIVEDAEPFL